MTEYVRKSPWAGLIALLILHLFLLSVQIRSQEGQLLLRVWGLTVLSPLASLVSSAAQGIQGLTNRYLLLSRAQAENERLRLENAQLKIELTRLRELEHFVERQGDYDFLRGQYDFQTRLASVLWASPPFYRHRVVISAGSGEGVRRDLAVVTAQGVVGRVVGVTPFSSEVELVTNAGAAVGAMVGDSRLQGVLQGEGSSLLSLNFVPNHEEVPTGEWVFTSGTDKIYPKGMPVGVIVESRKGNGLYRFIRVKPFVDYHRLEEVMVLIP